MLHSGPDQEVLQRQMSYPTHSPFPVKEKKILLSYLTRQQWVYRNRRQKNNTYRELESKNEVFINYSCSKISTVPLFHSHQRKKKTFQEYADNNAKNTYYRHSLIPKPRPIFHYSNGQMFFNCLPLFLFS